MQPKSEIMNRSIDTLQYAQHVIDFLFRVVVQQAQSDQPRGLDFQRLGERQGVEVAVPGEDAGGRQAPRKRSK